MPRPITKDQARALYAALATHGPAPKTELTYTDPFTLLVAVVLSAQATDVGVNKATAKLFPVASTPETIYALGEKNLGEYIRTIGLWRNKAKNVIQLCRILIEDFDSTVPQDRETLETLPGVGRKTANVVCNEAFGQPTIAVDTHIFRVSNRTRLAPGKTPLAVEKMLERRTPDIYKKDAHHWLILHGRYVCKARTPECWRCSISDWCLYTNKTPEGGHPKKTPAKRKTPSRKVRTANTKNKAAIKKAATKISPS